MKRFLAIGLLIVLSVSLYAIPQPKVWGSGSDSGSTPQPQSEGIPQPQFVGPPPGSLNNIVNIVGATAWSLVDGRTIIVYRGSIPIALVQVMMGSPIILGSSEIRFLTATIGPMGSMTIDGVKATIWSVKNLR